MVKYTHSLKPLYKNLILFLALFVFFRSIESNPLSEKDIIELTLKQNSNILISRINSKSDSLDLKAMEALKLPQINALAGFIYSPLDSTVVTSSIGDSTYNSKSSQSQMRLKSSISASQVVPGGGEIGGMLEGTKYYTDSSSDILQTNEAKVNLSFSQPLLKNAWKHAEPYFSISIERLDNDLFTLEQKKNMLTSISEARLAYWTLYEKQKLLTLYTNELKLKKQLQQNARQRLAVGEGTIIDTLSAAHEYLEAYQLVLSAKAEIEVAQNDLADILMLDSNNVEVDTLFEMVITSPPNENEILKTAKEFDPDMDIFEVMKEKLTLQLKNDKNQMLPDLRFETSYSRNTIGDSFFKSDHYYSTNLAIGLILKYDLPIRDKKISLKKRELAIEQTKLYEDQYDRKLKSRIAELVLRWNQEIESLNVGRLSQKIAKQQAEATRTGYKIGSVDRLTLLKAENDFLRSSIRVIQKELGLKNLEILFEETTGTFLSRYGVTLK